MNNIDKKRLLVHSEDNSGEKNGLTFLFGLVLAAYFVVPTTVYKCIPCSLPGVIAVPLIFFKCKYHSKSDTAILLRIGLLCTMCMAYGVATLIVQDLWCLCKVVVVLALAVLSAGTAFNHSL